MQPLAYRWYRGPATVIGDLVVMDGRRAETYEPMGEIGVIGFELARTRIPEDVARFVSKFGPLKGVDADEPCPDRVEQPVADFERAAADLRDIVRTILDVQKAASGDAARMARLRERYGPLRAEETVTVRTASGLYRMSAQEWLTFDASADPVLQHQADSISRQMAPMTDAEVLIQASGWATMGLSNGLIDAHPYVFDPAQLFPHEKQVPGSVRLGILPQSLLGFCYLSVAQTLERRADGPIESCPECGRVFVIRDKRQQYCEPACAARARWKRFNTKPRPERKGTHGKTTRER